jgi:hypothetical protein
MGAYGKMLNGRIVRLVLKSPSCTSPRGTAPMFVKVLNTDNFKDKVKRNES